MAGAQEKLDKVLAQQRQIAAALECIEAIGAAVKNCARHFRRTMEILEPTVIVAEGQGVWSWIGGPLGLGSKPTSVYEGPAIPEVARIAGERVDILTFNHPSAAGQSAWWGRLIDSPYLKEVVEPTILRWRNHWARNQP